jgi:Arc/MetJ-type ribon-helix-helix transcriptional regulator
VKNVTFRVHEETKKEMDRLPVNWSEYLRATVQEVLDREKKREIHEKLQKYDKTKKHTAQSIIRNLRDNG